jgi:hypothetical protein
MFGASFHSLLHNNIKDFHDIEQNCDCTCYDLRVHCDTIYSHSETSADLVYVTIFIKKRKKLENKHHII